MDYSLEALGRVVQRLRSEKGLTQSQLGSEAGYRGGADVSISRIESGFTRPTGERFSGIARALGVTDGQLEAMAWEETERPTGVESEAASEADDRGREELLKDRFNRISADIEERQRLITTHGEAFNEAHDRARDGFFVKFIDIAKKIDGAERPPQDEEAPADHGPADSSENAAQRLRFNAFSVADLLAGVGGGAAAGAAFGGVAAYATFLSVASVGTASTGAAIATLSGAAATNATLAALGGGALAAGGAGVAGGTALLAGIVAAPAVLLTIGGLIWMAKRNRKRRDELRAKLDEAEAEMTSSKPAFDAVIKILGRATETLGYIATHASHAIQRWERELGTGPWRWDSLSTGNQDRYLGFIRIAGAQLAVATIDVHQVMSSGPESQPSIVETAHEVITQSQEVVEELV